jgi:predicted chitinase
MRFDETTLFTYLRRAPFGGRLSQSQIDGVNRLIGACRADGVDDLRHVANVLAQVFHETAARMQPIKETVMPGHTNTNPSDRVVISRLDTAFRAGKLPWVKSPYWRLGWFGRGDIQITHKANYERAGRELGVDLVGNPSKTLDPQISAKIAVRGMRDGWFTGKKLADYFNANVDDARGARRIVNGTDKASLIATYHKAFFDALKAAETSTPLPADVVPEMAQADDVKPSESPSLWTMLVSFVSGSSGLAFLGGINNPYAFAALLAVLAAGGIGAYLVLSGKITFNRGA